MDIPEFQEELREHLGDQIYFLMESTSAYDKGSTREAKRLALAIRILLNDGKRSKSLLTLLKKKDILFLDTSYDEEGNQVAGCGLLMTVFMSNGGEYVAPLGNGAPMRYQNGKIPFEQWWGKTIFVNGRGGSLTRRDLVLTVCDKDGGAHVDLKLDNPYRDFSRANSLGWKFQKDAVEQNFAGRPQLASIRQVAYEVLKSLEDEFPEYF